MSTVHRLWPRHQLGQNGLLCPGFQEAVEAGNLEVGTCQRLSCMLRCALHLGDSPFVPSDLLPCKLERPSRTLPFSMLSLWPAAPDFCFLLLCCLQATADASVISCLHTLSRRIAIVLQHEERRCQYLTREAKLILAIQDEVSAMSESEWLAGPV